MVDAALGLYAYLDKDIDWSKSGHEDIFRYKVKTLVPDDNKNIFDTGEIEKAISVAGVLEYHGKLMFIVVASKNSTLKSIKAKKTKKKNSRKARAKNRAAKISRKKNRRKKKKG